MKRVVIVVVVAIVLAGCAPGANELVGSPGDRDEPAGFLMGLWHGVIAPVTFVISLFSDSVSMYEVHNSGGWYNFGFLLGMMMVFGGGGGGAASGRRRYS